MPVWSYNSVSQGNQYTITPDTAAAPVWLAIVSSETMSADHDIADLSIYSGDWDHGRWHPGANFDYAYLGVAGSVFPLRGTPEAISVEFSFGPLSSIVLLLELELKDKRVIVTHADYEPRGCSVFIGPSQFKHLDKWLQRIRKGIEISPRGYIELDVPNPKNGDPLEPGDRYGSANSQCSARIGTPTYYSLEVRPTDPEAFVYLEGKYLGTAGSTFRIARNPADILIRKAGFPDIAKQIQLRDGLNYLDVVFQSKPALSSKPKSARKVK